MNTPHFTVNIHAEPGRGNQLDEATRDYLADTLMESCGVSADIALIEGEPYVYIEGISSDHKPVLLSAADASQLGALLACCAVLAAEAAWPPPRSGA
jgi:hypothetical protein